MTKKVIILLVDAFRHDYVTSENTPYLKLKAENHGWSIVKPCIGFCERTELLTGISNTQTKLHHAFDLSSCANPYTFIHYFLLLIEKLQLERSILFKRIFRRLLWEYASLFINGFHPANIPLGKLSIFDLTEDHSRALLHTSKKSLVNKDRIEHRRVNIETFTGLNLKLTGSDDDRLRFVIENFENFDTHFLYIGAIDKLGHHYGPSDDRFTKVLKEFDRKMKTFMESIIKLNPDCSVVFIGDHGMTDVIGTVDVQSEVFDKLENVPKNCYETFLDSTSIRLWWRHEVSKDCQKYVNSVLEQIPNTYVLWNRTRNHPLFGREICVAAKPGYVLSHDFFNSATNLPNGMHGYDPSLCADMKGVYMHWDGQAKCNIDCSELTLVEIYDQISKVLV